MEANILRILVVLVGVALVAVVLIQQPKEGGMGAFTGGGGGSGASSTVFGAKGSGNFLFKLTAALIVAFAVLIIALVKVTNSDVGGSVLSTPTAEIQQQDAIPGAESAASSTSADSAIPGAEPAADDSVPGAATAETTEEKKADN